MSFLFARGSHKSYVYHVNSIYYRDIIFICPFLWLCINWLTLLLSTWLSRIDSIVLKLIKCLINEYFERKQTYVSCSCLFYLLLKKIYKKNYNIILYASKKIKKKYIKKNYNILLYILYICQVILVISYYYYHYYYIFYRVFWVPIYMQPKTGRIKSA